MVVCLYDIYESSQSPITFCTSYIHLSFIIEALCQQSGNSTAKDTFLIYGFKHSLFVCSKERTMTASIPASVVIPCKSVFVCVRAKRFCSTSKKKKNKVAPIPERIIPVNWLVVSPSIHLKCHIKFSESLV